VASPKARRIGCVFRAAGRVGGGGGGVRRRGKKSVAAFMGLAYQHRTAKQMGVRLLMFGNGHRIHLHNEGCPGGGPAALLILLHGDGTRTKKPP